MGQSDQGSQPEDRLKSDWTRQYAPARRWPGALRRNRLIQDRSAPSGTLKGGNVMTKWLSLLTSAALLALAAPAQAQTYPSRTVTIVVTAAAGGVTDVLARAIGARLSEMWGQQVVIENKGGGAHIVGAQQVAKASPDGHTIMFAEAGTYVINPNLYPKDKLPFDMVKDFIPITGLIRIHHSVMVSNKLGVNNVSELIDLAKKKPGEITYGTAGIGSGPHVNVSRFENVAKVKLIPIHYRGANPAINDIIGGHTNMMMVSVGLALPVHRDGKLKMLSIGSSKRLPQLPEFPTTAESGKLPGYVAGTWFGMAVTGGTPRPIVDKINKDVRAVMAEDAFKKRFMERQYAEAMDSSPEEFQAFLRTETQNWAKVIREQNLSIAH
ncbi:MAG: tripartite tricarboxylate transporter substrate binding protein [Alphaproteobacteria bacterium]|nr:tripartite tricarboxylate transporter substrate binding protein [Alphaproteobacteria bacterium]